MKVNKLHIYNRDNTAYNPNEITESVADGSSDTAADAVIPNDVVGSTAGADDDGSA